MIARHILLPAVACVLALASFAGPVRAQSDLERRIDRLEKTIKTLQAVVFQAQATGQPVVVKPEGPDPELDALRQRMDDLEQSRRTLTGQIETLTHDMQEANSGRTADKAAADARIKTLNDRIAKLESQLTTALAQASPAPATDAGAPAPDAGVRARLGDDATTRAQAGDTGVLGTLRTPGQAPVSDEAAAYRDARAQLTAGDYAAATAAFQDFVARYPDSTRTPEAYYWLGETYYLREAYRQSTAAYAAALKSKPKTSWAPDAWARLSESLAQSDQNEQACAAAEEFDRTYKAKGAAPASVRTRVATVRRRAKCG